MEDKFKDIVEICNKVNKCPLTDYRCGLGTIVPDEIFHRKPDLLNYEDDQSSSIAQLIQGYPLFVYGKKESIGDIQSCVDCVFSKQWGEQSYFCLDLSSLVVTKTKMNDDRSKCRIVNVDIPQNSFMEVQINELGEPICFLGEKEYLSS